MSHLITPARERILQSAFELISNKGYLRTTTREIAKHARVAEVTIFRKFVSKENLFAEVLGTYTSMPVISKLIPEISLLSYEEAVEALAFAYLRHIESNKNWIRLLHSELEHAPKSMHNVYEDFVRHLFEIFTDFFQKGQERGYVNKDLDPEHAARAFHSMLFGLFHVEGTIGFQGSLLEVRRAMVESFVKLFCLGTRDCCQFESL